MIKSIVNIFLLILLYLIILFNAWLLIHYAGLKDIYHELEYSTFLVVFVNLLVNWP